MGRAAWQQLANRISVRVLEHFRYVGVLAIEFFVQRGRLIANEMAPRVHNSGHWTIEGAVTSQFENHLRAILRLPLGATRAARACAMINLIGTMPPRKAAAGHPRPAPARLRQERRARAASSVIARSWHAPVASAIDGRAACSPHWPPTPASLNIESPGALRIYAPQCGCAGVAAASCG